MYAFYCNATSLHEKRVVDHIVTRLVPLCTRVDVDADGGGCRNVYNEDVGRLAVDQLALSLHLHWYRHSCRSTNGPLDICINVDRCKAMFLDNYIDADAEIERHR
ncbi:hypothetical protein GW17_00025950 [Ensete ventricosum]|nr:hypothetical protein GW17_00025950 [Ensete ventricosum]